MLKHLNNSFATAIIFGLFAGITRGNESGEIPVHTIVFCIFFILFRVKTYIEDYAHFKEAASGDGTDSRYFLAALFVAVATWCLWALSGYTVVSNEWASCLFMALSLLMSTLWLGIGLLRDGKPADNPQKERMWRRCYWILINVLLGIILSVHLLYLQEFSESKKVILMSLLVAIVIGDFCISWGKTKLTFE